MDKPSGETRPPIPGSASLKVAMRKARIESAERSDVVADLQGAEIARLELLQDALAEVFAQIPPEVDLFDTGLVPGAQPRLFIDMLGFVEMARDRRTYRFLRDTRHGRQTIVESDDIDRVAAEITTYVARRLVEREKALAADRLSETARHPPGRARQEPGPSPTQAAAEPNPSRDLPAGLADGSWVRVATNVLALLFVVLLTLFLLAVAAHEWQRYG